MNENFLQVKIIPNVETQFESGEKVSLLNFLPENTIVWSEDWEFIKEKIEQELEDVEADHISNQRCQKSGINGTQATAIKQRRKMKTN